MRVKSKNLPVCEDHLAALDRKIRQIRIPDHIRADMQEKGSEAFLFNRQSGEVYALNETGAFILKAVLTGKDAAAIIDALQETFAVDSPREAAKDLNFFVDALLSTDLIGDSHVSR